MSKNLIIEGPKYIGKQFIAAWYDMKGQYQSEGMAHEFSHQDKTIFVTIKTIENYVHIQIEEDDNVNNGNI